MFESDLPTPSSVNHKYSSAFHTGSNSPSVDENASLDNTGGLEANSTVLGNGTELENDNATLVNATKPVKTIATCILRDFHPPQDDSVVTGEQDTNVTSEEVEYRVPVLEVSF